MSSKLSVNLPYSPQSSVTSAAATSVAVRVATPLTTVVTSVEGRLSILNDGSGGRDERGVCRSVLVVSGKE